MNDASRCRSRFTLGPMIFATFILNVVCNPNLFLFRRDREDESQREEAFARLFKQLNLVYRAVARMKPRWEAEWVARESIELPPKFEASNFTHPDAVAAARDLKSSARLLHQNRWSSKVEPLFTTVNEQAWSQLRSTVAQAPPSLQVIMDRYTDGLREDENTWIKRAIKSFDQSRSKLNEMERRRVPNEEIVATLTASSIVASTALSENLLERLRQDAAEE